MKIESYFRLVIGLVILFFVIHGWWFVALPISVVYSFFVFHYYEIIFFGIVYDSLFGYVGVADFWKGYIGTIVSVALFFLIFFIKRWVR